LSVIYRDQIVGEYYADLIVEDKVICELKAVDVLKKAHEVHLVNYLVATGSSWVSQRIVWMNLGSTSLLH